MKKIISLLTCSSLLLSSMAVFAQEASIAVDEVFVEDYVSYEDSKSINEPTSEKLEEIIKKVRPLITVPEEYTEFFWDFNAGSYYSLPSWSLGWTDGKNGEIYIGCDNDGRITSYNKYNYNEPRQACLPDKSPDEFTAASLEFVKKTSPHLASSDFVLTNTVTTSLFNDCYTYRFTRYENGIIVPDNSLTVSVNHKTGEVKSYYCSYTADVSFNDASPVITPEKAKEILGENQDMVLSYSLKTEYNEETGKVKSRNAYLVYRPENSYVSVDAYTGQVYNERNTWSVKEQNKNMSASGTAGNIYFDGALEESARDDMGYQLTEQELEQLGVLDSLITKDEAIAVVTGNDSLYIDEKATAVTARLNKDYNNIMPIMVKNEDGTEKEQEQYVWHLTFTAPSSEDIYNYSRMSAVVDANDGKLISFSASTPDHWYYTENNLDVPSLAFSAEQAEKIASDFIAKMQPEKSSLIRLTDSWEHTAIMYNTNEDGKNIPVYGNKSFTFTRVNEGVDFTYNYFNASVDRVTGKVTNYDYTWYDDVVFESPEDVISAKDALMALYSYDGFGINYEINSNYTYNKYLADKNSGKYLDYDSLYESETYSRLVYSAYNTGTNIIRAMDGVMITGSGEEYKVSAAFSYDDIDGHWAQQTIERFTYIGVGFDGGKFLPDNFITDEELTEIFYSNRLYAYGDVFTLPEGNVTRVDAVKYIILALGYYKVACLEDVFITDFADNTVLKDEDVGFIAIAKGFGLIEGDGNTFRPYDYITRAEALTLIKNVIDSGLLN
ncbi:MAG: S-layer homology domain-containing protein [Clostridia bacterium]|nr:S-layer homology domain-containing protein [Clostridia bacterium]